MGKKRHEEKKGYLVKNDQADLFAEIPEEKRMLLREINDASSLSSLER